MASNHLHAAHGAGIDTDALLTPADLHHAPGHAAGWGVAEPPGTVGKLHVVDFHDLCPELTKKGCCHRPGDNVRKIEDHDALERALPRLPDHAAVGERAHGEGVGGGAHDRVAANRGTQSLKGIMML